MESLYSEPMVIVLRPGHALAAAGPNRTRGVKAAPALTAIGAYPLVLPLAGTLIRHVADGSLGRHGISAQTGLVERSTPRWRAVSDDKSIVERGPAF